MVVLPEHPVLAGSGWVAVRAGIKAEQCKEHAKPTTARCISAASVSFRKQKIFILKLHDMIPKTDQYWVYCGDPSGVA